VGQNKQGKEKITKLLWLRGKGDRQVIDKVTLDTCRKRVQL